MAIQNYERSTIWKENSDFLSDSSNTSLLFIHLRQNTADGGGIEPKEATRCLSLKSELSLRVEYLITRPQYQHQRVNGPRLVQNEKEKLLKKILAPKAMLDKQNTADGFRAKVATKLRKI